MDRYLVGSINYAKTFGTIESVCMGPANKWTPPHIEFCGKTRDNIPFSITICVGESLPQKEEAENAEAVQ